MIAVALLCAGVVLGGCRSRRPEAAASAQDIVGLWTNVAAKGQPATLFEIGFDRDGAFRHAGSNALGRRVNFGGRYEVGSSAEGPFIRLTYDDYPDKPTTWFFRLEGDRLTVAPDSAALGTEAALVFKREQEQ